MVSSSYCIGRLAAERARGGRNLIRSGRAAGPGPLDADISRGFGLILSWFNWRNNKAAYWVAAFIITAEDIGFLLFPVGQGGSPSFPASIIGPGLWIIGLVFTTIAYLKREA